MSGFGGFGQQPNQSGFGSGFGTSQTSNQSTQPAFGFNAQQNNTAPQPNSVTTPFGAPAPGFGQAPAASAGFGDTSNAQSTFGASNQQQSFGFANSTAPAASFGTPAKSGFGSSGFGTPAPSAGFGAAATSSNATFGSSPAPSTGFGSGGGFGGSAAGNTGFGNSPAPSSGFGSSSNTNAGFGSGGNNTGFTAGATGFGGSSSTGFGSTPAPSTASSGFGVGNAETPASSAPLTFGSSSTVAFGSSSTTAAAAPSSGFGSGFGRTSNTSTGFALSGNNNAFGQTSSEPSSSGFGQSNDAATSNQTGFGFGAASSGANKSSFGFGSSSNTSTPFGKPDQESQSQNDDNTGHSGMSSPFGRIPRKERKPDSSNPSMDAPLASSRSDEVGDEQLAALRAKIQEKKNRLLRMKKGNQNNESSGSGEDKGTLDSQPKASLSNSELAAKNALRFAGNNQGQTTTRLLPTDLQGRASETQSSSDGYEGGSAAEEDDDIDQIRTLSGARDLIGVCKSMCPDEELLRREREGDIQLLEITDPGGLHPQNWTLRDTAVKRFRRSAADFKLDIPELVRPPEVLERVCGYLEEWVMERDRQGPDKRFAQQPSIVPPPLDVYQFIWDRTRMIRKDFILQNYIGDGGKCDARAVRCHERIARWHAMCEHQLSHIQEFVTHQSQQNIAELGQTMKTLNLYYDDALGRSLNEEMGDSAKEHKQGCASDIVMGKSPVDFDGSDLSNNSASEDVSKRIIGDNGLNSSTRGTAEPEMRGLYILLTMNNEGGMEVIKYSGRLCTQRPEIFYSKPVQLALSIFQARKDHNYAKFFHLLRSPSTPYLFSCIMFKYVEQMRKTALTIMSRTYGAKHKTTGESFYDEYPLTNLVKLLCFEDEEEARTACTHYGITLEGDIIRWRNSKFAEPRDPVKNIILNLKPKKMIRTIECKLKGATRLSVCRGGVSGEGATLSRIAGAQSAPSAASTFNSEQFAEQAKKDALEKARQQKLLEKIKQEEARRAEAAEQEARRAEEAAKKEAERQRLEEEKQRELERKQRALEEKKRLELKRQEELRMKKEKEEREAQELEASRKRAEEEQRERERLMLLEKQRKEEEQKRRIEEEARRKAEEEENARRQEEMERQRRVAYELEQKRIAEEERRRKEAEENERKWLSKVESAQKTLIFSLWMKQMRKRRRTNSGASLESIDPTVTSCSGLTPLSMPSVAFRDPMAHVPSSHARSFDDKLYRLATASRERCNLSQIAANIFWGSSAYSLVSSSPIQLMQPLLLFKLSVVLPQRTPEIDSVLTSLQLWADSHLQFQHVTQCTSHDRLRSRAVKIRAVASCGNNDTNMCSDCDAVLFLLPSTKSETPLIYPSELINSLPQNVPRMLMLVCDDTDTNINCPGDVLSAILGSGCGTSQAQKGLVVPPYSQLDNAFRNCCESLIATSLENTTRQPVIRVSLSKLAFLCIQRMLINMSSNGVLREFTSPVDTFHDLYDHSMNALTIMIHELTGLFEEIKANRSVWPAREFISKRSGSVENYFEDQSDLPHNWHFSLRNTTMIEDKVYGCFQYLFSPESFTSFVASTAEKLTDKYKRQRLWGMLDDTNVAAYFVEIVSLIVSGEVNPDYEKIPTIFLPIERMLDIIETAGQFNAPVQPKPKARADIPSFLYEEESSYDLVEANTLSRNDNTDNKVAVISTKGTNDKTDVSTPAMHKRKPSDGVMATPIGTSSAKKRTRIAKPNKIEPEEVKASKDFTSYLEALLG